MRQMRSSGTNAAAASVSVVTIGIQGILDAYLCIGHLIVGIVYESSFKIWASVAFLQFFVFSIFEMRFMLTVWKAMRFMSLNNNPTWSNTRQELSYLYSRFYSIFFMGLVLFYEYWVISDVLVLLLHSFWIPQIVYNYQQNSAKGLDVSYIIIITMTRSFIPLYVFLCPKNVAQYVSAGMIGAPNTNMGLIFLFHILSQMIVLLMQRKYGAAFFVPKFLRSPRYDYYRRVPDEIAVRREVTNDNVVTAVEHNIIVVDCENDDSSCSDHEDDSSTKFLESSNGRGDGVFCTVCMSNIDISTRGTYVLTPCDHFFHTTCLQKWTRIKLACPTCRQPLPPM